MAILAKRSFFGVNKFRKQGGGTPLRTDSVKMFLEPSLYYQMRRYPVDQIQQLLYDES